ncbi:Glycosyltransferase [Candidatus Electrothrix aarhusensis]
MDRSLRIHVIGKDAWALGTEDRLARACLSTFATVVDSESEADFIHTVDVEDTAARIYRGGFAPTKPIVGAVNNHPTRLIEWPGFLRTAQQYMHLVPQSSLAAADMERLGIAFPGQVRIATDAESYRVLNGDDPEFVRFRREIAVPEEAYLIGLLQRDSEGRDLAVPKRQKGPDIFLGLMKLLQRRLAEKTAKKVHVLLGGPRRHWIRAALDQHNIPYTFVGKEIAGDDYPENILDKQTMCMLYNMLDLYVIPTRWEGAPRQVFDVLECGRKIISTPVGIAPDILSPECIFESLAQGVEIILRDMECGFLEQFIEPGRKRIQEVHSIESVGREWEKVYRRLWEREGTGNHVLSGQHLGGQIALNRFSGAWSKPFSAVLEKTRLGRIKKEYCPKHLGLVVNHRGTSGSSGLLDQLGKRLRHQGVQITLESPYECSVLIWNVPLDTPEYLSKYLGNDSKKVILVLDEMCCARLLQESQKLQDDSGRGWKHPLLERAEVTILTSDIDVVRLHRAGIKLNNPMVLRFPPDPAIFSPKRSAERQHQTASQCLVFLDPEKKQHTEWVEALEKQVDVACHVVSKKKWGSLLDVERATIAQEQSFAVILSEEIDRKTVSEVLACGLPCLYTNTLHEIKSLVGMAGVGVDDMKTFVEGGALLCKQRDCFASAILMPSLDEAALVLADLVYKS